MKIFGYLVIILIIISGMVVGGCGDSGDQPATPSGEISQVRYLGAPVGSNNFMLAALFANQATKDLGMPAGAFPGGSVENIKAISNGDAELGYCSVMDAYNAYNGLAPFDKSYQNIRFLDRYSSVSLTFAVRQDSDIKSLPDLLDGKKLAIGTGGSTAELFALYVLEEGYGITPTDIENGGGVVARISYSEMGAGLADKTLDCVALFTFHTNVASKHQAAEERWGLRIIPISDDALGKILDKYSFFSAGVVDGGVYKGSPDDVQTISSDYIQIVRADISEDMVYQIMNTLWDEDFMASVWDSCPALPDYQYENMLRAGLVIPMHAGAAKYYAEKGMTLPAEAVVK